MKDPEVVEEPVDVGRVSRLRTPGFRHSLAHRTLWSNGRSILADLQPSEPLLHTRVSLHRRPGAPSNREAR